MKLKIALISGPMYDPLYDQLKEFESETGIIVEIAFKGDHPALNHHLTGPVSYDLVSTHTKYAPSQKRLLAPLDGLITTAELDDFMPTILDLVRINGGIYGLPRNIDLRLLHYRTDLIDTPPQTWDDLLALAHHINSPPDYYGFVFPGRESGLFGTFFELAEVSGATLFPQDLIPRIENEGGRWALNLLRQFYSEGIASPDIINWHYDQVHEQFKSGKAAMIGDWPGYYGSYRDPLTSQIHDRFNIVPYPVGPTGISRTYAGGHTFALTKLGAEKPEALALLKFLAAPQQQLIEAQRGSVPVRRSVMAQIKNQSAAVERQRWDMMETVVATQILIPPKFSSYPAVEDVLWTTVQRAITGQLPVDDALHYMTEQIRDIVSVEPDR